jgi:hypothetical protein
MTPTATKYAAVVARLTDLTNVLRSRAGAIEHIDRNGHSSSKDELIIAQIRVLEKVVRDLERTVNRG